MEGTDDFVGKLAKFLEEISLLEEPLKFVIFNDFPILCRS